MCRMSETYQSKRWQRLLEALPPGLREHVSLRNVEAVAALPSLAQERLGEAIEAGLKRLPRAVEQLKLDPNTSIADLLNPPAPADAEQPSELSQQIHNELADFVQMSFPDMPRISAEALANADVMDVARQIIQVHHNLFDSSHLQTDFVMVVVYALVRQALERLEEIIADTPACRQTIHQSALPWNLNDWRKQDA